MSVSSPVDGLIKDHEDLLQHLLDSGETSYHAVLEGTVPKVLLVAAASWMETRVKEILADYFKEATGDHFATQEFIRQNVIDRGFHTLFEWKTRNPAKFFAGFGEHVKKSSGDLFRLDEQYAKECSAFLELGQLRNNVVHQNYAAFTLNKTAAEVADLYRLASSFVDRLPGLLLTGPPGGEPEGPSVRDSVPRL